jgi:hypothetical protein
MTISPRPVTPPLERHLTWATLPGELLHLVFLRLSRDDLLERVLSVCRAWAVEATALLTSTCIAYKGARRLTERLQESAPALHPGADCFSLHSAVLGQTFPIRELLFPHGMDGMMWEGAGVVGQRAFMTHLNSLPPTASSSLTALEVGCMRVEQLVQVLNRCPMLTSIYLTTVDDSDLYLLSPSAAPTLIRVLGQLRECMVLGSPEIDRLVLHFINPAIVSLRLSDGASQYYTAGDYCCTLLLRKITLPSPTI